LLKHQKKSRMTDQYLALEQAAGLGDYRLPLLAFQPTHTLPDALRPLWKDLRRGASETAHMVVQALVLHSGDQSFEAPLRLALSSCYLRADRREEAETEARKSIRIEPRQQSAHRILIEVAWRRGATDEAYFYLSTLAAPTTVEPWDELLETRERHLALAALAWRGQDWKAVRGHLVRAYPRGLEGMPLPIREDLFRADLYRDGASDAAAVAASLLSAYDAAGIDAMLHTLDGRGWSAQALELYRTAFGRHPDSPLLRRRLVGLCIREGQLDEARSLAAGTPLDLAA